jgi:DNA recombination protein RmuC
MATTAFFLLLTAVLSIVLGFWLGLRKGAGDGNKRLDETLEHERKLSATREEGLKGQLDTANAEIKDLRPKMEELSAVKQQLANEEKKYAQMKTDLETAFKGAAADVLQANSKSFLTLAKQELTNQAQEAKQTLEQREAAFKSLLAPLNESLTKLDAQTREMEKERAGAYTEIKTLVEGIGREIPETLSSLKNETSQLINALRSPKTRGNWGELQLKRCVEYAGMVEYCSFAEQVSARDADNNLLRPDMTIQLPSGRTIIVDAKTPLDSFLDAAGGGDPATQAVRFAAHAERVRAHLRELSGRNYWKQFERTPDFVVCFLPSEALFSAALEADPSLIEFGAQSNVMMATPTTLIALLKAVAYGWQQSQVTENAKAIQEVGQDLYNKLVNTHQHFEKLGSALGNVVGHYNKFVGAIEGRGGTFYHARKLGKLVHGNEHIDALEPLEAEPRPLTAEDWPETAGLALAAEGTAGSEA